MGRILSLYWTILYIVLALKTLFKGSLILVKHTPVYCVSFTRFCC